MSAFSRGFALRRGASTSFQSIHASSSCPPRFFSSSTTRAAKSLKNAVPRSAIRSPHKAPKANDASINSNRVYQSFEDALNLKTQPILLYEAPPQGGFIFKCYISAFIFFATANGCVWYYREADRLGRPYIALAFGAAGLVATGMGTYFLCNPFGLIQSIKALPKTVASSLETVTKRDGGSGLQLEVETRRWFPIPFMPTRKIYVRPREIVLPRPLSTRGLLGSTDGTIARLSPSQMKLKRLEAEAAKAEAEEYERNHLLTLPFRQANRAMFRVFTNQQKLFTRNWFMDIRVQDIKLKLDVVDGKALEGGRVLNKLVDIKLR